MGSVSAAALESVNGDSGVVLLAASSKVTKCHRGATRSEVLADERHPDAGWWH